MKTTKKLLLGLFCVSAVAGLASCEPKISDEEHLAAVKASLVFPSLTEGIRTDFEIYPEIDGVTITYASANEDLLSFNEDFTLCTVKAQHLENSMELTSFTATFTYNDLTDTKKFNVKVLKAGKMVTVDELNQYLITNGNIPTDSPTYAIKARVAAKTTKSTLLYDGTGYIYAYKLADYEIGDYVYVDGSISLYNGIIEFNSDTAYGALYEDVPFELPEFTPVKYNKFTIDDLLGVSSKPTFTGMMVSFTGKVIYSSDGKYINFELNNIDTGKVQGSVVSPTEEVSALLDKAVEEHEGKCTIVGYALYKSGGKYVNLIVTDVIFA